MKFKSVIILSSAIDTHTTWLMCLNAFALLIFIYGWAGMLPGLCRFKTLHLSLWLSEHALERLIRWVNECFGILKSTEYNEQSRFYYFSSVILVPTGKNIFNFGKNWNIGKMPKLDSIRLSMFVDIFCEESKSVPVFFFYNSKIGVVNFGSRIIHPRIIHPRIFHF